MALKHEFSIVDKSYRGYEIFENIETISISDDIILYINDSLKWIDTIWHGNSINKGINYYGYSIIENKQIFKLIKIIEAWKYLFSLATEDFYLTGCFCIHDESYEKLFFKKNKLLTELELLIFLCKKAIKQNSNILHRGI